jgi:acetyltransferase-like isoleucine patch superfamily enzyme
MSSLLESILFHKRYGFASRMRIALYRRLGMRIGNSCRLENIRVRRPAQIQIGGNNSFTEGCWLWPVDENFEGCRIRIGDGNYFNRDVMIDACGSIEIGRDNMFGPWVYMTDSNHTLVPGKVVRDCPMDRGRIVIGDGCWIGAKAIILKDVTLGDKCVVAAGAVVTRDVPPGAVVAGVPARPLKVEAPV